MLNLSHNRLTAFPLDMPLLCRLRELLLCTNHLTEIPKEIMKMKNLVKLDLSDNYLTQLPETLIKIQTLKELNLTSNVIFQWPTNFIKLQDKVNVSQYYPNRSHYGISPSVRLSVCLFRAGFQLLDEKNCRLRPIAMCIWLE